MKVKSTTSTQQDYVVQLFVYSDTDPEVYTNPECDWYDDTIIIDDNNNSGYNTFGECRKITDVLNKLTGSDIIKIGNDSNLIETDTKYIKLSLTPISVNYDWSEVVNIDIDDLEDMGLESTTPWFYVIVKVEDGSIVSKDIIEEDPSNW